MTIELPESSKEVEERIKLDVAREAPDSNPYLKNHWLLALITGFGRRLFDFYRDMSRLIDGLFPDTATGDEADKWGQIYGVTRNPATQSSGSAVAIGSAGTVIPSGSQLSDGINDYQSTAPSTVSAISVSVLSITRSGDTATVTTVSDHGLASNVPVSISGANETDYNLSQVAISVTGLDTFTYPASNTPVTPATGTILAAFDSAVVPVKSVDFGVSVNLTADTPLTLNSPIAGLFDVLNVDFNQLAGGSDIETDNELRARYLSIIRNPVAHFNVADIESKAREVPGVTRVFVEESDTTTGGALSVTSLTRAGNIATAVTISGHGLENGMTATIAGTTEPEYNVIDEHILIINSTTFSYLVQGSPATPAGGGPVALGKIPLGVVRVLFTRDNDLNKIPSGTEIQAVVEKLEDIRPANTSKSSLIVVAPVPVTVNFTFTSLEPDTFTMRAAIIDNLGQFFDEETIVGNDITQDAYRAAIQNTIDTITGDSVQNFTLSLPLGTITLNSGEIGLIGIVSF